MMINSVVASGWVKSGTEGTTTSEPVVKRCKLTYIPLLALYFLREQAELKCATVADERVCLVAFRRVIFSCDSHNGEL